MNTLRIALPDKDALTEKDINNFGIYADIKNVISKEFRRGSLSVATGSSVDIKHGLGYIPFVIVFYQRSAGVWKKLLGRDDSDEANVYVNIGTEEISFYNSSGSTRDFKYFIFYDQIV